MLVGLSCGPSHDAIEHHWVIFYAGAVVMVVVVVSAAGEVEGDGWGNNSNNVSLGSGTLIHLFTIQGERLAHNAVVVTVVVGTVLFFAFVNLKIISQSLYSCVKKHIYRYTGGKKNAYP